MRYGREISAAVDPLDLGWPAVAVRAGVGLVYSVLIEEVVTPRSVGGRTGAVFILGTWITRAASISRMPVETPSQRDPAAAPEERGVVIFAGSVSMNSGSNNST